MPLRIINDNFSFDVKIIIFIIIWKYSNVTMTLNLKGRLCSPFNPSQYISVCNYIIIIRFLIDILLKRRTTVPTVRGLFSCLECSICEKRRTSSCCFSLSFSVVACRVCYIDLMDSIRFDSIRFPFLRGCRRWYRFDFDSIRSLKCESNLSSDSHFHMPVALLIRFDDIQSATRIFD